MWGEFLGCVALVMVDDNQDEKQEGLPLLDPPLGPPLKRGAGRKLAREERQAKALRDNLKRRKQQNRSRGQAVTELPIVRDTTGDTTVDSGRETGKNSPNNKKDG